MPNFFSELSFLSKFLQTPFSETFIAIFYMMIFLYLISLCVATSSLDGTVRLWTGAHKHPTGITESAIYWFKVNKGNRATLLMLFWCLSY